MRPWTRELPARARRGRPPADAAARKPREQVFGVIVRRRARGGSGGAAAVSTAVSSAVSGGASASPGSPSTGPVGSPSAGLASSGAAPSSGSMMRSSGERSAFWPSSGVRAASSAGAERSALVTSAPDGFAGVGGRPEGPSGRHGSPEEPWGHRTSSPQPTRGSGPAMPMARQNHAARTRRAPGDGGREPAAASRDDREERHGPTRKSRGAIDQVRTNRVNDSGRAGGTSAARLLCGSWGNAGLEEVGMAGAIQAPARQRADRSRGCRACQPSSPRRPG